MTDERWIDLVARTAYEIKRNANLNYDNWSDLPGYSKRQWRKNAARFITAIRQLETMRDLGDLNAPF